MKHSLSIKQVPWLKRELPETRGPGVGVGAGEVITFWNIDFMRWGLRPTRSASRGHWSTPPSACRRKNKLAAATARMMRVKTKDEDIVSRWSD